MKQGIEKYTITFPRRNRILDISWNEGHSGELLSIDQAPRLYILLDEYLNKLISA